MAYELRVYLNFPGNTAEAMTYYQGIFGGELQIMTFGDAQALPEGSPSLDKVMNAELRTPHFTLMAADIIAETPIEVTLGNNYNIALVGESVQTLEELASAFDALAAHDNATVVMPLTRVMWGAVFGSLVDGFGVPWMFNIDVPAGQAGRFDDVNANA
ncbi:VOC family protein [Schaalia suimastitidis]|uniref:VOC family protein n=1 Tax=Schaalia suimastitidis TaxID=121163 RepID=UPI0004230E1E|nr:VOC family protein [Schaalia suimastitidis]